jgi:hypothetical protein
MDLKGQGHILGLTVYSIHQYNIINWVNKWQAESAVSDYFCILKLIPLMIKKTIDKLTNFIFLLCQFDLVYRIIALSVFT